MKVIFFSTSIEMIDEWEAKHKPKESKAISDKESLLLILQKSSKQIVIADYDSVAQEINQMIASNTLPINLIVLEKTPEVVTGKMLISHGIKAYGNSRMLAIHYEQMLATIIKNKIWTYPELTVVLGEDIKKDILSEDSFALIEHRLSEKEKEVLFSILEGLTNDAIAQKLSITTRTVKAHITSIFSKLHVNDRLALVLLLK